MHPYSREQAGCTGQQRREGIAGKGSLGQDRRGLEQVISPERHKSRAKLSALMPPHHIVYLI